MHVIVRNGFFWKYVYFSRKVLLFLRVSRIYVFNNIPEKQEVFFLSQIDLVVGFEYKRVSECASGFHFAWINIERTAYSTLISNVFVYLFKASQSLIVLDAINSGKKSNKIKIELM